MQNLNDFIKSYQINEHLIDQAPQMIFIMGLPAAGKSSFINMHLSKYFPSIKGTRHTGKNAFNLKTNIRTLDSDIQLNKRQKHSAMAFARDIYDCQSEEEFNVIKTNQENTVNASSAQSMLGINFKISTDWAWVDMHKKKDSSFGKFQNAFLDEFFKKDWAINFEVRPIAKQDYKELMKNKLSPDEFAGLETFNNNDIVIPVTGDDIDKIYSIIDNAKGTYAVSIIYLDMPLEVAVEKDEGRRKKEGRGVGRALIEEKDGGIKSTWRRLSSGDFKRHGIYKLLHFEWVPVPGEWGKYNFKKEYVNTQMIKDFLPSNR